MVVIGIWQTHLRVELYSGTMETSAQISCAVRVEGARFVGTPPMVQPTLKGMVVMIIGQTHHGVEPE